MSNPEASSRRPRRPTIRDVSRLSGVSHMTVSRVISTPDRVAPATRERVLEAITSLGYVPDRAAGSLSSRRSGFVALILPTLNNANFATVARGLSEVLHRQAYQLLIAYDDYDLAAEESQLTQLLARRPEAIVLTGAVHRPGTVQKLAAAGVPVVEISDLPARPIQHAVGFSNEEVGRIAARYFIERGFAHIGAIGSRCVGDKGDYRGDTRLRGFEAELRAGGRSLDLVCRYGSAPVSFGHGAMAIGRLLDQNPDVDAVFAVSDLSAVGVVMECQRRGVLVPDDLSVMGFGDFEIGREINPALTTIHVDFYALGQRVGEHLTERALVDCNVDAVSLDVGLRIIERSSVKGKVR